LYILNTRIHGTKIKIKNVTYHCFGRYFSLSFFDGITSTAKTMKRRVGRGVNCEAVKTVTLHYPRTVWRDCGKNSITSVRTRTWELHSKATLSQSSFENCRFRRAVWKSNNSTIDQPLQLKQFQHSPDL
jgi:ABC-type transporter lipoprotein component MlaA